MITLNYKKVNSLVNKTIENYQSAVKNVQTDINNLREFSDILEIVNVESMGEINKTYNILYLIKAYEILAKLNDFNEEVCPKCKRKGCLHYHKAYTRNITFYVGNYKVEAIITLLVLECNYCKNTFKGEQHYHAVIPDFIFPYHIYESEIILDVIYERLINKQKIDIIINKNRITKELYYKWIKGFSKYEVSASTILGVQSNSKSIIKSILDDIYTFLYDFYQTYFHPFFLFKSTCVPLSLIP